MALDPIVSLSVAIAEAPGACTVLLGSGVSRDAGVPTGVEVLRNGLRQLHDLENPEAGPIDDSALGIWLRETGREELRYSDLLELITPDRAIRRDYLAGLFEDVKPSATHEHLAALASDGFVRVFVTTNFDRLLEHALQARGIEPIVVASDADLDAAPAREHAHVVIVKPHGDYLRMTIRNTPDELAELEPRMTAELREIFDRYGVVVIGYSGSDPAIAATLRVRGGRYGLWWVSRGQLGPEASDTVQAIGGRVITRESAGEFLADLRQRLRVFERHPSGLTPAVLHDETLELLRARDEIGLDELLRRERQLYETAAEGVRQLQQNIQPAEEAIKDCWNTLRPVLERRLASLLPLALHSGELFAREVKGLARSLERRHTPSGFTVWAELPQFSAGWFGYTIGALLVRLDRLVETQPLISQVWCQQGGSCNHVVRLEGTAGHALGTSLAPTGRWLSPAWEFVTTSLAPLDWFAERYPEIVGEGEPRRSMAQFDLLCCLRRGAAGEDSLAYFTLDREGPVDIALRLHRDDLTRQLVATATGLPSDEFAERAAEALDRAHPFQGGFTSVVPGDVASIISTGSWRG